MKPSDEGQKVRGRGRAAFVMQLPLIKERILRGELLMDIYADLSPFPVQYSMFTKYVNRYCHREMKLALGATLPPDQVVVPPQPSTPVEPPMTAPPIPLTAGPKVAAAPAQKKFSVSPVLPPKDQLV